MSDSAIQEHPARFEPGTSGIALRDAPPPAHHDRGLLLIGLFKLGKSAFFVAVGIGAIRLLHKDLGDVAMRLAMVFHQDPEGRFVGFLVQKVDLIDVARLRQAGLFSIAYAALALTEGVGLMLEKVWAEYLTLCLTISFLPWELYELVKSADVTRLFLLLANLAVLAYIVWLLRRKKRPNF
jgi:uncharacterized membrane protein (DUF2068 family)